MTFLYTLALATAVLVVAPYLAHRLRRRRAEERPFAPARLVAPAPPKARRRSRLEDRALFVTRVLAVLALALLGAAPFVRCERLSLTRSGGASVAMAIVVDDSMSMRAPIPGGTTSRFERARKGALELLSSTREGDAVAVVLAGAPVRVALSATTDLSAARAAIEALEPADRGTDLDGAVATARGLLSSLPQVDRRVVVLSDLADGNADGPPLGEGGTVPVWVALPELAGDAADCGVLTATRSSRRVSVRVACNGGAAADARELVLREKEAVVARSPLPKGAFEGTGVRTADMVLLLPPDEPGELVAELTGGDAVAADDRANVLFETGPGAIAVVADAAQETAATGGAPVVEQALAALRLDIAVRPTPILSDRIEDLSAFAGIVLDDPPGFTPEQRRALTAFVEQGGVTLLALGPRAAAAPLGATLEPLLLRPVTWQVNEVAGADPGSAIGPFTESAASLEDVGASHRALLAPEDSQAFERLLAWGDGATFVGRRSSGRGNVWVVTLPFAVDQSDLTLRPAFLALLDGWVEEVRGRLAKTRVDVGTAWSFVGAQSVSVKGPTGPMEPVRAPDGFRVIPPLVGAYEIVVDGKPELRVASPSARELDLRPRATAPTSQQASMGNTRASVDISWVVALVLLGLCTVELGLRAWGRSKELRAAKGTEPLQDPAVIDEARGP